MPEYDTSGWGKPFAARTWHYFVPSEQHAIASLCGKWAEEIYASGKPSVMLWAYQPPTYSIYGRCKGCTSRLAS